MALNAISGQHYSTYNKPVRKWTQENVAKYLKEASRFQRILDLGCGTGENSNFLQKFTGASELVGLDANKDFLKFAERHTQHSGIQYFEADLNKSDWNQNKLGVDKFDLVFSSFALHWIKDIERVFNEITEVMEEDGESFHMIGMKPSEPFRNAMKQLIFHPKWNADLEDFLRGPEWLSKDEPSPLRTKNPTESMKSLLVEAGQEVLLCEEVEVSYTCESHEDSKGLLEWLLPLTKYIPQTKLAEFMEDAYEIYSKYCLKNSEDLPIWKNTVLIVHTRKNEMSSRHQG